MFKVSVIIPTYNCVEFLCDAIDSVLSQTYQDFEIIIVDDGSTDNTKEIVHEYINSQLRNEKSEAKIKYFYQENRGPAAARNRGIGEAEGEYIAFLDADDIYLPEMLEKCIETFLTNLPYDVVISDWYQTEIGKNGNIITKEIKWASRFPKNSKELYRQLLGNGFVLTCLTVRKEYICKIGYYDEDFFLGEDLDLLRRFAKDGAKIGLVNKPLFKYRKRECGITTTPTLRKLTSQFGLISKYHKDIFKEKYLRCYYAKVLWDLGRQAFYLKSPTYFIFKCLLASQIYNPSLRRVVNSVKSILG